AGSTAPDAPQPAAAPTGDLDALAAAAGSRDVDTAVARLHDLEHRFHAMARGRETGNKNNIGEELGKERDQLVADIKSLRQLVAGLSASGLGATQLEAIQAALYRGINAVSPYYYQHNNVIYEYSKGRGEKNIYNTCNITSLSMCLEALGRTAADYPHPELLKPVAEFFGHELADKAGDVTSQDLTGYRLPEVVAMVATVHLLGNKLGTHDEIAAAAGRVMGKEAWLANINHVAILAAYFGASPTVGSIGFSEALNAYGKEHWKATDLGAEKRKQTGKGAAAGSLTTADIEEKIPAKAYKRAAMHALAPALDGGKQVVVGQFHHFVRLQSIDDQWVVKDDPGRWTGEDLKVTWEEARALGLFTNYCIVA
ncbi:MAG TPA: hypothetical protein VHN98_12705, partial [Acidimicrobiales bacterium]|nr:hypothetical protein [Acidimicrobiales bacterium]